MTRALLVLGYAQEADGDIDAQTRDRCLAALKLRDMYREPCLFYLTISAAKNGVAMADAMRRFLESRGVSPIAIRGDRRGGNTAGEMDVFISLVPRDVQPVFVSTWYHIPRIIWLAMWRMPWWRIRVLVGWRHAHFEGDVLVEFAKMANALLRPRKSAKVLIEAPR